MRGFALFFWVRFKYLFLRCNNWILPLNGERGRAFMADILVVGSKVKEAVKKAGCNTGGDFAEELSRVVEAKIKRAAERAKANGRKTVRKEDL